MGFLFDLVGELFIALLIIAAVVAWEHMAYLRNQRFQMWAAGLVGIGVLVWAKGPQYMWTWALAAGWLGALAYFDRRLNANVAAKAAEEARPEPAQDADIPSRRY
jgi:hypothetical protein